MPPVHTNATNVNAVFTDPILAVCDQVIYIINKQISSCFKTSRVLSLILGIHNKKYECNYFKIKFECKHVAYFFWKQSFLNTNAHAVIELIKHKH